MCTQSPSAGTLTNSPTLCLSIALSTTREKKDLCPNSIGENEHLICYSWYLTGDIGDFIDNITYMSSRFLSVT